MNRKNLTRIMRKQQGVDSMELKNLVMTELEQLDLKGAKITDLSLEVESTEISFEINEMKIDFVIKKDAELQVLRLTLANQIYTDEVTLNKCNDWANYIWAIVEPMIKKHQDELEKVEEVIDIQPSEVVEVETSEIIVEEIKPEETKTEEIKQEEIKAEEVKPAEPEKTNEAMVKDIVEVTTSESIEDAVARGHKEGYKAARKKNALEIRQLKRKYRFILFFTIIILIGAFAAFLIFHEPLMDALGLSIP